MAAKMVVDIKSDALRSGREMRLTGSTAVRACINDMPVDRLAAFLALIYPERRLGRPAAETKAVSKTAAGTLDEVIDQLGFGAPAD
ncbi:hypothetical protein [Methyloceanibacter sp.]|uniref:hypothetical protein n=1 Tax=Methyloceanibacter sp. TaxID=1965321 RepID=UPI002D5ECF73|nr:hypothetical protein [Methyloceanibacter sp.]HZP10385.1 hypothetical protein [Methyloceanibacter sp.]